MSRDWPTVVNAIFHYTQFEKELDDEVVERISRALISEPLRDLTAAQEHEALTAGLDQNLALPSTVRMRQSPSELREFLRRISARMDERRPWREPAFTPLPDRDLDRFENATPIARITLPYTKIEAYLARGFSFSEDGPFLLLRLRLGAVIGMFTPVWENSDDVLVATTSALPAEQIVDELVGSSRLPDADVILLDAADISALYHPGYATTPISPEFEGESLPGNAVWRGSQVSYLTAEERKHFLLTAHEGLLYDSEGCLYDTTSATTLWTPAGGRAIFVMDDSGNLYSSPRHVLGRFHHSSFLAGAPAAGAGEISVVRGQVRLISDQSSHYRPARRFTDQVVDSLRQQGVDIDRIRVEYHQPADSAG